MSSDILVFLGYNHFEHFDLIGHLPRVAHLRNKSFAECNPWSKATRGAKLQDGDPDVNC